jgi:hypothetical protein
MKNPMLSGYGIKPLRSAPGSKRKKNKTKRGPIKNTVIEPKWMRRARATTKSLKRATWNVLSWVGAITLVFLLLRYLGGGG